MLEVVFQPWVLYLATSIYATGVLIEVLLAWPWIRTTWQQSEPGPGRTFDRGVLVLLALGSWLSLLWILIAIWRDRNPRDRT
jgi:hypothetical protein